MCAPKESEAEMIDEGLLEQLRALAPLEKLEVVQFLVANVKDAMTPPAPPQPASRKSHPERTMQLSVTDLIADEDDSELQELVKELRKSAKKPADATAQEAAPSGEAAPIQEASAPVEAQTEESSDATQASMEAVPDPADLSAVLDQAIESIEVPVVAPSGPPSHEGEAPAPEASDVTGVTEAPEAPEVTEASEEALDEVSAAPPTVEVGDEVDLQLPTQDIGNTVDLDVESHLVLSSEPAHREGQEPEDASGADSDDVYEEIVLSLEGEEMRLMDALGTARRLFWSPLRDGFVSLELTQLLPLLRSIQFAPMRLAINDLVGDVIISMVRSYHGFLHELLEAKGLQASAFKELFITKKNHGALTLALRMPFREYISRLEQLDVSRDELLSSLEATGYLSSAGGSPLMSLDTQAALAQRQEAQGIEDAWRVTLDAIRERHASDSYAELDDFLDSYEKFLDQLGFVYSAVLNRVLEVWNDHLVGPARETIES